MENEEKGDIATESNEAGLQGAPEQGKENVNPNKSTAGELVEADTGENFKAAEKYEDFAKEESADSRHFSLDDEIKAADSLAAADKKGFKGLSAGKKKVLAVVVAFLLLVGVVAAAYLATHRSGTRLATDQSKGDTVVKASMQAMKGVKSYNYDGKLSFGLDGQKSQGKSGAANVGLDVTNTGVVDYSNAAAPASYGSISLSMNSDSDSDKATGKLGLETAYLDKTFYLKLNDLAFDDGTDETAASMKQAEGFLEVVKNNWYFVSDDDMQSFYKSLAQKQDLAESAISPEEISKFNEIASNYNLLRFYKDLGDDQVNGTATYHYQVQLDSQQGFELAVELIKESLQAQGDQTEADNFEQQLKEKTDEVNKAKELVDFVLNEVNAEVWIGKNDNLIYRIKLDGNFDKDFIKSFQGKYQSIYGEDGADSAASDSADMNIDFSLDYSLSNFNTATVRKPADAKDLKKVIDSFSGQAVSGMTGGTDSDSDGLSDEQEKFYGTDPNKADTDGDGYKDGDEVKNGYDPTVAGSAKLDYAKLYSK